MNRDELRRLAEKATPGPWLTRESSNGPTLLVRPECRQDFVGIIDAEYIAAANPVTILELLDTVDGLVGALKASPCPSAVGPRTVRECVDSDSCVCYNETVLAKAKGQP